MKEEEKMLTEKRKTEKKRYKRKDGRGWKKKGKKK
jgi:hypothetical protein